MRLLCASLTVFLFLFAQASGAEIRIVDDDTVKNSSAQSAGWTLIEAGNSKGQTFLVKESVTLTALTLKTKDVSSASDLTIEFFALRDGVPDGDSLHAHSGKLPEELAAGQLIKMDLEKALTLTAGTYAFILSTVDSELRFAVGDVVQEGRLIRKNKATKGKWVAGAGGRNSDLWFVLTGLPTEERLANQDLKAASKTDEMAAQKDWALKRYTNPEFEAGSLVGLKRQPNIITVMVDDLGWNQIGVPRATLSSNSKSYHTPNLMRLAEEGLCFTNAYAQPNCAPTRAAMLSGQYPARIHNGVYVVGSLNRHGRGGVSAKNAKFVGPTQSEDVALAAVTVAEALKENGYQTAHIGKYHVGGHQSDETLPENVGFDINIGGFKQGHQPVCFATEKSAGGWGFRGLGRGDFDRFAEPYSSEYLKRNRFPDSLEGSPKHVSDAVADAMEETLVTLSANDRPFYLQVHPYAVHGPVRSRPDLQAQSGGDAFYGFVRSIDLIVGRLFKMIEDPNGDGDHADSMAEHTLVLFTSDNGGTHKNNLPLKGTKGMFTEGGIRVPLIAWWPGKVPAKTVSHRLVHTVDYFPTYLKLAGNQWTPSAEEHPLDGHSFAETLLNPRVLERGAPVFYLFPGYLDQRAEPCLVAIDQIDGKQYKLLYHYEADAWQLYNIGEDITESNNLVSTAPEITSRLANALRDWLRHEHPTWSPKLPIVKQTGKPAAIPNL